MITSSMAATAVLYSKAFGASLGIPVLGKPQGLPHFGLPPTKHNKLNSINIGSERLPLTPFLPAKVEVSLMNLVSPIK